jgi:predicted  nucleic acid-binding Zn-ribbon protein
MTDTHHYRCTECGHSVETAHAFVTRSCPECDTGTLRNLTTLPIAFASLVAETTPAQATDWWAVRQDGWKMQNWAEETNRNVSTVSRNVNRADDVVVSESSL